MPYVRKNRSIVRVLVRETVNLLTEPGIVVGFGLDETVERVGDEPVANNHHPHAAYAAALSVGGLEINGGEILHNYSFYEHTKDISLLHPIHIQRLIQNHLLADVVGGHTHDVGDTVMLVVAKLAKRVAKRDGLGENEVNIALILEGQAVEVGVEKVIIASIQVVGHLHTVYQVKNLHHVAPLRTVKIIILPNDKLLILSIVAIGQIGVQFVIWVDGRQLLVSLFVNFQNLGFHLDKSVVSRLQIPDVGLRTMQLEHPVQ